MDCSVYLAHTARGRRLGTLLYGELLPLLASLGHHRAHAGITLPDEASVALHLAHGFSFVRAFGEVGDKLGRWRDVSWFQKRLDL